MAILYASHARRVNPNTLVRLFFSPCRSDYRLDLPTGRRHITRAEKEVLRIMTSRILVVCVLGSMFTSGCSTMSDTAKGAGIGGAIGTGVGLAAGAASGNPRTGAVVGGLVGAGLGGAVGNASDNEKQERREIQQAVANSQAAQAQARMGMADVIKMSQDGQSDSVIINQIHATGSSFQLTATDLSYLKQNGVSDAVIIEMQNARPRPTTVVSPRPVYVSGPPVVYAAPPPPLVIYGRPRGYYYRGGCW